MQSLVKISYQPFRSLENRVTVRVVEDGKMLLLICRKISQLPTQSYSAGKERKHRHFIQWKKRLSRDYFHDLFSLISDHQVPVVPTFPDGLDGALYTLELNVSGYGSKFSWWSIEPRGYEPLAEFFNQLFALSDHDNHPHVSG